MDSFLDEYYYGELIGEDTNKQQGKGEYNPPLMPKTTLGNRSVYYVSEAELWQDTLNLYETGEFPERLAVNITKMVQRILTSRRFNGYTDVVKEEAQSAAISRAVTKLMEHKFDPKRGSKVYSWLSRLIINECLQTVLKENKRQKQYEEYVEDCIARGEFEIVDLN
jgi:hypothetical protein